MEKVFLLLMVLISFSLTTSFSQSKKEMDQKAIKSMCGCFEVDFNFAETFHYSKDPNYKPSAVKHSDGLEWAQLVVDEDNKIVIQHLLIGGSGDEQFVIKHWRQDWLFENTKFYMFNGDNNWTFEKKEKKEVVGQWTQKVFQVDDSPRYEGAATWVHVDGKSYWENTTDAPLPRREYTKRNDYNVTKRQNRQEITTTGWVHEQDNGKIIRSVGKEDVLLAEEKGYNYYQKVKDEKCQLAMDWWKENDKMWSKVRDKWDAVFAKGKDLKLKSKVEDKRLYQHLFSMKAEVEEKEIKQIIKRFVEQ